MLDTHLGSSPFIVSLTKSSYWFWCRTIVTCRDYSSHSGSFATIIAFGISGWLL